MQQERDDLDAIIKESANSIQIPSDYNERLIMKLNNAESGIKKSRGNYTYKNSAAALSLIISGLLLIFIGTTNFQNSFYSFNSKVKTQLLFVEYEYNYKFETLKNNIGGWY